MYERYWQLTEKPFENTPDPRFLYYSAQHEEALVRLLYAVRERKGAAMLTGDYGCGKTVLSRALLAELESDRYRPAVITHPHLTPKEFIGEILFQLGKDVGRRNKIELIRMLNDELYDNMKKECDTIIIVDEAQMIGRSELFEELRLLLNFQLDDRFLLTLIFMGQPELREKIARIPQLKQRLGVRYHLGPLPEEETGEYVRHRLSVAGCKTELFEPEAVVVVHEYSGGTPREINNICDMAMLVGFGKRAGRIDAQIVTDIRKDLEER